MKKTAIPRTDYTLVTNREEQTLKILGGYNWIIKAEFIKQDKEPSLDENGDVFELEYKLVMVAERSDNIIIDSSTMARLFAKNVKEIQILFEFLEENKKNLFDELGFRGVLL